jgi:hypothetical protein
MAAIEPIMASWVAASGSIVAEGATVGICVGMAVAEGAIVSVANGTVVMVAGEGSVGIGVCVPGKACETTPQASESKIIDNGKNERTFNMKISFLTNCNHYNFLAVRPIRNQS